MAQCRTILSALTPAETDVERIRRTLTIKIAGSSTTCVVTPRYSPEDAILTRFCQSLGPSTAARSAGYIVLVSK